MAARYPNLDPFTTRLGRGAVALVLGLGLAVLGAGAALRGMEYDEGYTALVLAGTPRPVWPDRPASAAALRTVFAGRSNPAEIATTLRQTDVHPPLYFWALWLWRGATDALGRQEARDGAPDGSQDGAAVPRLWTLRLFSVLAGVAALALVGAIARIALLPAGAAMLLTLGCYGFAYTGMIARGFALAQALSLLGVLTLLLAQRHRRAGLAFAGGVLLGLASFTNYLACFVGIAALLWLAWQGRRALGLWLAGWAGFALILPGDLWFFLAQRDSRAGQFPPFSLPASLAALARDLAAALFGGLPRYLPGAAGTLAGIALAGLLAGLAGLILWRWRRIGRPGPVALLGMAALAPPLGLVLLGAVFDTIPIELRYLAFATPFAALLLAGALANLPPRIAGAGLGLVLAVQALSLAGLLSRPETMQPQRAAALAAAAAAGPEGLVLVPRGNDGVGVAGVFIASAPATLRLLVVGSDPRSLAARSEPRMVIARLALDRDSRALLPDLLAGLQNDRCWRQSLDAMLVAVFERRCGAK